MTASANVKDPQTFNRYSYAMNSPYKFTDPLGLISEYAGSACGLKCANSDSGLSMSRNDSKDVSGNFAKEQQAEQPESPPPPPAPADNGTIDASEVVVDAPIYSQNSLELGGNIEFDETLTSNATNVIKTVAQNDIAYQKNRENWKKETKAFNDAVDNLSSFEAKDWTSDLTSERNIGTVQPDGTIVGVPEEFAPGGLSLNIPIGGSGDSQTIKNTLGVASADKANSQIKLLNAMQSEDSDQRKAFIKTNEGSKVTVMSNGQKIGTTTLGSKNAGTIYDNAIKRGFAASAAYWVKK